MQMLGKKMKTLSIFVVSIVLFSCSVDPPINLYKDDLPVENIVFKVPSGWPQPVYSFENNSLSEAGFRLGRRLFYDTKLSRDNTISCGSCHQDFAAFAHSGHALSHGIDGLFGTRNAPALFNLNWHPQLMWDGGINHIEVQALAPITNPVEMDETLTGVIAKLEKDALYKVQFSEAFGDSNITSQRLFKALTQFQGMLISNNSKYDRVMQGNTGVSFTPDEQKGYDLFTAKCSNCHTPPLFTDFSFRNNGLTVNTLLNDSGRAHITGNATDRFKFKVPSLRNIALSSPYMHDGRFQTLQECIDHYRKGIQLTQNLDIALQNGITLSDLEKEQLIAFLNTLSDYTFTRDPRFKDPN